jgi:hypothetical protein
MSTARMMWRLALALGVAAGETGAIVGLARLRQGVVWNALLGVEAWSARLAHSVGAGREGHLDWLAWACVEALVLSALVTANFLLCYLLIPRGSWVVAAALVGAVMPWLAIVQPVVVVVADLGALGVVPPVLALVFWLAVHRGLLLGKRQPGRSAWRALVGAVVSLLVAIPYLEGSYAALEDRWLFFLAWVAGVTLAWFAYGRLPLHASMENRES